MSTDARSYADVRMIKLRLDLPSHEELPLSLVRALIAEAYAKGYCDGLERAREAFDVTATKYS